jgi:hypothetical protein
MSQLDSYSMQYKDSDGCTGYAVVLNNYNFVDYPRHGSEIDVENITKTLKKLNFKVRQPFVDLKASEMLVELNETASTVDFSQYSCFACVIMSHGTVNGQVFGVDCKAVDLEKDIVSVFRNHKQLEHKPKLFFVQACRSTAEDAKMNRDTDADNINWLDVEEETKVDKPAEMDHEQDHLIRQAEGESVREREPNKRENDDGKDGTDGKQKTDSKQVGDVLIHRSTIEQFASYRNKKYGSVFINSLCKILGDNYKEPIGQQLDVDKLLKLVNNRVGIVYGSQHPEYSSSLKKDFYFRCKNNAHIETPRYVFISVIVSR